MLAITLTKDNTSMSLKTDGESLQDAIELAQKVIGWAFEQQIELQIVEEEDDAMRYSMQLEEMDYPLMHVIEIESDLMIHTCETHGHRYAIISKNDIVIPPDKTDDNL